MSLKCPVIIESRGVRCRLTLLGIPKVSGSALTLETGEPMPKEIQRNVECGKVRYTRRFSFLLFLVW